MIEKKEKYSKDGLEEFEIIGLFKIDGIIHDGEGISGIDLDTKGWLREETLVLIMKGLNLKKDKTLKRGDIIEVKLKLKVR